MSDGLSYKSNEYPCVVTLRFKSEGEAADVLQEIPHESRTCDYNENEMGQNIYYITHGENHD